MKIKGLRRHRRRNQRGYFDEMPFAVQQHASEWLAHFLERHPCCPGWRFPILVGKAKRLALTSEEERSAWGRSMQAKKGGYAVQQRYRWEGRIGLDRPALKAAEVSAAQRKWRRQERLAAQAGSLAPSNRLDSLCSERATRNAQKGSPRGRRLEIRGVI